LANTRRHFLRALAGSAAIIGLPGCGDLARGPAVPRTAATRATVLGVPNERFYPFTDLKPAQEELMQAMERRRQAYGVATAFDIPRYEMLSVSGGGADRGRLDQWRRRKGR